MNGAIDWAAIGLVIFDVDGTLYNQRSLRLRMARDLVINSALRFDRSTLRILSAYRRIREEVGDAEVVDFEPVLIERTAAAARCKPHAVRAAVDEWINQRPLPYLKACRYPGVAKLFTGLKRHGKMIGVLSDYPAVAKVAALSLTADVIIAAGDDAVRRLKPDPRGLELMLAATGTRAEAAVMIGDRVERDGAIASRVGMRALIRSSQPIAGWQTFQRFDDPLFVPVLAA